MTAPSPLLAGEPVLAGDVGRIAVLRALPGLGDLLCAVPALRAIRREHPRARVTLVGLPSASWLLDRYPDLVDDLLVLEGVAGLPEVEADADAAVRFVADARARRFDLALQLHGSGVVTNAVTTLLGARRQVTAHPAGEPPPSNPSIPYPDDVHEVHRLLAVAAAAGCPPVGDEVRMPVHGADRVAARALLGDPSSASPRPHACLHPGASRPENRWPPERFAAVGDALVAAGHRVVLTGTAGERPVVAAVAAAMAGPAADTCGRTSLGTLAALFAGAGVVVSNDTGAAHLAAAVRAPSVVVFPADGDPARWAPLDDNLHARVAARRVAGSGPTEDLWPPTAAVVDAAMRQLARRVAAPGPDEEDP